MVMEKLKQLKKTGVSMKVLLKKYCTTNKYCTPDSSKTSRINKWPSPKLVQEMQQFLGQANYYKHFIKNFATIAKPLHQATEKSIVLSGPSSVPRHSIS